MPASTHAFIAALAVAATALSLWALPAAPPIRSPLHLPWLLIAAAMVAACWVPVRFHTGRQSHSVDLFDVPMLVGAVFTPPSGVLLAVALATVVTMLRRRDPLTRAAFNLANQVASVCIALIVLGATLHGSTPNGLHAWPALALTLATYDVLSNASVVAVVAISSGVPRWHYLKGLAVHHAVVIPMNAGLGIVAVTIAAADRWALILLAGLGTALVLWYRAANLIRTRYANLQLLYTFTGRLAGVTETAEVIALGLSQARALLRCHRAELCLPGEDGTFTRYRISSADEVSSEPTELSDLEREVAESREPARLAGGAHADLARRGFADMIVAAVGLGERGTGVALLADSEGEARHFDAEDERLFVAMAAQFGTAITSSRRLERVRQEMAARERDALHDALTGLPNRALFTQLLAQAIHERTTGQKTAVMVIGLDGFEDINDSLGHEAGDALLKETGARLLATVGDAGSVASLGGDQFAVLIPAAGRDNDIVALGETLITRVSAPVTFTRGLELVLRPCVGISMGPRDGMDSSTLLRRADAAMNSAKRTSQRLGLYRPHIDERTTRRLILAADLQRALDADELDVWFQPVADLRTETVLSFEALTRWFHPEHGPVSPVEFIPIAEKTGLIEPLTWWVLRKSIGELRRWQDDGYEMTVAVNISARSLFDTTMPERLRQLLVEMDVPPQRLILEVTESSIMSDPELSEQVLKALAKLGVAISVDDFGTGHSSLSRLKMLPVHILKIDRTFVKNMCSDADDEAIVQTTVTLAHSLGRRVVAEGVEDRRTWDRLSTLGCDEVQGYFLSPPLPAPDCRSWLRAHQKPQLAPVQVLERRRSLKAV